MMTINSVPENSYPHQNKRYRPESRKNQKVELVQFFMGKAVAGILSNQAIVGIPGVLNNLDIQEETVNKISVFAKKVADEVSELIDDLKQEERAKHTRKKQV